MLNTINISVLENYCNDEKEIINAERMLGNVERLTGEMLTRRYNLCIE